jgi:hypothetical protein
VNVVHHFADGMLSIPSALRRGAPEESKGILKRGIDLGPLREIGPRRTLSPPALDSIRVFDR